MTIFDSMCMIVWIHVELRTTVLDTKYRGFGSCCFREEEFSCISRYKPMADNDAPGCGLC